MTLYPPKVNVRFRSPRFCGRMSGANAVGTGASFECGCFVRISMAIDSAAKAIRKVGFQSNGCGYMVAAADAAAERLTGRELVGLNSLDERELISVIEAELGPLPSERVQCAHVVLESLRGALADYRTLLIEEFRGEEALICTCFGVSENTIGAFITANSPGSVEEVTAACRAGAGCGSCRMLIQEMIDERAANFP